MMHGHGVPQVLLTGFVLASAWGLMHRADHLTRTNPLVYSRQATAAFKTLCCAVAAAVLALLYWGGFYG